MMDVDLCLVCRAIPGAREIAVRLAGRPPFESGLHLDQGWLIPISLCHFPHWFVQCCYSYLWYDCYSYTCLKHYTVSRDPKWSQYMSREGGYIIKRDWRWMWRSRINKTSTTSLKIFSSFTRIQRKSTWNSRRLKACPYKKPKRWPIKSHLLPLQCFLYAAYCTAWKWKHVTYRQ